MSDPVVALFDKIPALHDTDADTTLVDSLIEAADALDAAMTAQDDVSTKLEDFMQLATFLREYMDTEMQDLLDKSEILAALI
jgi:hypothetical protein